MDALEAFGDDRANAEQERTFRGPIPRTSSAVLLARDREQGHAVRAVALRGIENRHLLSVRQMCRPVAFARRELIAQADVAEGAAHEDFVIPAPGPVAVELAALDALRQQVAAGRAVRRAAAAGGEGAGGGWGGPG